VRPLVTSRGVALVGLAGVAVIAVGMLRGTLDLVQAAERGAVLLAVVLVVEHLALPVARALVGSPQEREGPPGQG